jgi:hypothetical protein
MYKNIKPTAGITHGMAKVLNPIKKYCRICSKKKLAKTIFDKQVKKVLELITM